MKKIFLLGVCLCMILLNTFSSDAEARRRDSQNAEVDESAKSVTQTKPKQIQLDRNYDGEVDRIETYTAEGVIIESQTDVNGDTKIDEWVYYENGKPVRVKKDINGDGTADTTSEYDTKGIIVKSETDANGDTKIDEWVYYENGKPVRAEKDTNGDGKSDTWVEY